MTRTPPDLAFVMVAVRWTPPSALVQNVAKRRVLERFSHPGKRWRVLCGEWPLDQPRTLDYTPAGVLAGGGNPVVGLCWNLPGSWQCSISLWQNQIKN